MLSQAVHECGDDSHIDERELLCDLLLQVAGRDTNRLPSVLRHVAALDAAIPYMTPAQAAIAEERIRRHETRFGSLLVDSSDPLENGEIAPIDVVMRWVSLRHEPTHLFQVLHLVAVALLNGQRSLSRLSEIGYRAQFDGYVSPVTLDTFREWLLQLRIARRDRGGDYGRGHFANGGCWRWTRQGAPGPHMPIV